MPTYQIVSTIKHEQGNWSHLMIDFEYLDSLAEEVDIVDYKVLTILNVANIGTNQSLSFETLPIMEQIQIRCAISHFWEYERIAALSQEQAEPCLH